MPAVYGVVTPEIFIYDSNSSTFDSFCLSNVAPCQRIKVCFDMDEASYNSAAEGEGLTGTFFDYLQGITVQYSDTLPAQISDLVLANDPFLNFSFNSNFSGGCVEFRIPEDWAGTLKYLLFTYQFKIATGDVNDPYDYDYITVPFRLVMNTETIQISGELKDSGGTALTRLCDTEDEPVVCFTETLPGDYDFFPVLKTGSAYEEEDGYTNTNLPQLTTPKVLSTENDFLTNNDACLTLDEEQLTIGQETCIKAIAIKNPVNTVSPPCPCLDFSSTSTMTLVATDVVRIEITYSIVGATNYQNIVVTVPINTSVGSAILTQNLGTANVGAFSFQHWTAADPVDLEYTWTVTLENGCEYTEIISHSNVRAALSTDVVNSQNCGNRGNCSVSVASATQNCDFEIEIPDSTVVATPRTDSKLVDIDYRYDLYNSCISATVPVQSTSASKTENAGNYGYGAGSIYGGTDFSANGYVDNIRVSSYYMGAVNSTDIDCTTVIYDGVDQAGFATALQARIESEIAIWNIPSVGTGATNGVDYTLAVFMFSDNVLILFDTKHLPAGLWIGVDRTNASGSVYPDGVTPESPALTGSTVATSFCGSYTVPCDTLAIARSIQNMIVGLSYGNFYEVILNPSRSLFTFSDGSSGTWDGCGAITLNFDETCSTDVLTATPSGTSGAVNYSWTYNGVDMGINAATVEQQGAGDYVVTIIDAAGCLATDTITI